MKIKDLIKKVTDLENKYNNLDKDFKDNKNKESDIQENKDSIKKVSDSDNNLTTIFKDNKKKIWDIEKIIAG